MSSWSRHGAPDRLPVVSASTVSDIKGLPARVSPNAGTGRHPVVVAHGGTHGRSRDTQGVSRDVAQPAADGYAAGASAYLRGRPSYPAEAVEGLLDHFGSPSGQLVVDLGAGTGQLTCPLADREVPVLAVDP